MPDRDLFDLPRPPHDAVVADEVVEEGHEPEAVGADLAVPDHEAAEEIAHDAIRLEGDRVPVIHEEDEDIAVGGVEGGGPEWVHGRVACGWHPPAVVTVYLPAGLPDLVVVDAAVVGTDETAQALAAVLSRLAHELHLLRSSEVPESQVQGMGGEGGAGGRRGDLTDPLGRSVRQRRELAQAPMSRAENAHVLLFESEGAAGQLAAADDERVVRDGEDAALVRPPADRLIEIIERQVALIVGAGDPLLMRAGQVLLKGCDRHGFSLPGCAGGCVARSEGDGLDDAGEDETALDTLRIALLAPAVAEIGLHFGRVRAAGIHADARRLRLKGVGLDQFRDRHAPGARELIELGGFGVRCGNGCHALSFPSGCSCRKRMVVAYRLASVVTHRVRPWRVW